MMYYMTPSHIPGIYVVRTAERLVFGDPNFKSNIKFTRPVLESLCTHVPGRGRGRWLS